MSETNANPSPTPLTEGSVQEVRAWAPGSAEDEIETLIRARYPLISIVSWEEDRVLEVLDEIGRKFSKTVIQWTINSGLSRYHKNAKSPSEGRRGTKDPIIALREIETEKSEPTIFVLKDFHRFMDEAPVVRGLRDLAGSLRDTYTSVILLSPVAEVPPELEKDLTIVDFPLPGRPELNGLFDQMVAEASENPDLSIEDNTETRSAILEAAIGLTLNEAENVFAKILLRHGTMTAAQAPEVYQEKKQIIRKSGLLEYIETDESIDYVGGMTSLKGWLRKRRRAFHPTARKFGLPVPKGVMLLGVQGCGKSLAAKAVSRSWRMPLLRLDMGRLFGSLVGSSEENVRRAIHLAESLSPAILWIDEIDKGFSGLQSSGASDSGTTARVFGTLLTWLQEKTAPIFVIATANNVEQLPPELMRQGRFDEIFFIDLPTPPERAQIFKIHLTRRQRNPKKFDIEALAKASEGFSGSEIEQSVISGLYDAFDENRDINQDLLIGALSKTRPLSRVMAEDIRARRAWAKGRTRSAS